MENSLGSRYLRLKEVVQNGQVREDLDIEAIAVEIQKDFPDGRLTSSTSRWIGGVANFVKDYKFTDKDKGTFKPLELFLFDLARNLQGTLKLGSFESKIVEAEFFLPLSVLAVEVASFLDLANYEAFADVDNVMVIFESSYLKVKYPQVANLIETYAREASERPLRLPGSYKSSHRKNHVVVATLAYYLQRDNPEGCIYLPQELIAKHVGCDGATVSRIKSFLEQDGYLTLVEKHVPHQKATRYKFELSKVTKTMKPKVS